MEHFARFALIFSNLSDYRIELMQLANQKGYPLIRPLAMHFGYDDASWNITNEYLMGQDILVAPCVDEGAKEVSVYFPMGSGPWIHIVFK